MWLAINSNVITNVNTATDAIAACNDTNITTIITLATPRLSKYQTMDAII